MIGSPVHMKDVSTGDDMVGGGMIVVKKRLNVSET